MKVPFKKYASELHNTPLLPGQMFKSREDLVKAIKTALQIGPGMSPENYGDRMRDSASEEGIQRVQSILKAVDSKMNGLLLSNSMYEWNKFFSPIMSTSVNRNNDKVIALALQGIEKLQQTFNEKRSFGPNWQQHSKEIFQLGTELVNLQKTMKVEVTRTPAPSQPPMSTGTPQAAPAPAAPAAQPL